MLPGSIQSIHAQPVLTSLQSQGESNNCGPYTIASVINAIQDTSIQGRELALEMNRPAWRGPILVIRRIPNSATFPWGMVDILRQFGMKATWRFLASPDHLLASIMRGNLCLPILASWEPFWAHVMTLIAWDSEHGWGFANTQATTKDIYWLPETNFRLKWNASARLLVEVILA